MVDKEEIVIIKSKVYHFEDLQKAVDYVKEIGKDSSLLKKYPELAILYIYNQIRHKVETYSFHLNNQMFEWHLTEEGNYFWKDIVKYRKYLELPRRFPELFDYLRYLYYQSSETYELW